MRLFSIGAVAIVAAGAYMSAQGDDHVYGSSGNALAEAGAVLGLNVNEHYDKKVFVDLLHAVNPGKAKDLGEMHLVAPQMHVYYDYPAGALQSLASADAAAASILALKVVHEDFDAALAYALLANRL